MAPLIYTPSEIVLDNITIRERDQSIRYEGKPLYIQTPRVKVRKYKGEESIQIKSKNNIEWENFLVDFETKLIQLNETPTPYKRLKYLTLKVTEKTLFKSQNSVDISLLDLNNVDFAAIILLDRIVEGTLSSKLLTARSSTIIEEEQVDDEEPVFTEDDF